MATMSEILREVLGAELTDHSIWRATRDHDDEMDVLRRLLEAYDPEVLEPIPAKEPSVLRPAFLSDFVGGSDGPYDRELNFVGKALCYADEVAVVDEVGSWFDADDPERRLHDLRLGNIECSDGVWALRRIARYAELEEAGLLHYVPAPAYRSRASVWKEVDPSTVASLEPLVSERKGWTIGSAPDRTEAVRAELSLWFREFDAVFTYVERLNRWVDPYFPQWFAGPELLDWTFRNLEPPAWITPASVNQQQSLSQLLSLPAPAESIIRRLSASELVDIRFNGNLEAWRDSLRSELSTAGPLTSVRDKVEFRGHLEALAHRHSARVRSAPSLRSTFTELIDTGITVPPLSLALHQDSVSAALTAAAPLVIQLGRELASWFAGGNETPGSPAVAAQAASSVRTFMRESYEPNKRSQRPPSSWMVTGNGRPVAWDPFDSLEEMR